MKKYGIILAFFLLTALAGCGNPQISSEFIGKWNFQVTDWIGNSENAKSDFIGQEGKTTLEKNGKFQIIWTGEVARIEQGTYTEKTIANKTQLILDFGKDTAEEVLYGTEVYLQFVTSEVIGVDKISDVRAEWIMYGHENPENDLTVSLLIAKEN